MQARWIAVVALVCACSKPHVMLPAVSPNMTPEQRVQMFDELHAIGENTTTTTSCGVGAGAACSTKIEKTLYLANGTRVYHPEDLLPVVGLDSITARAIRNVHKHRRKALGYTGISFASMAGLLAMATRVIIGESESYFSTPEKIGLVVIGSGLVVGMFGASYHKRQAVKSWRDANENYNAGLAQRLGVCTSSFIVVPCESTTMPPSAPAPSSAPPGMTKPLGR
jgi:hypothetical protein